MFTSGGSKSRMDPFEPLKEKDVLKMRRVLDQVHQLFIADVVAGRGRRLHGDPKHLFSGDFLDRLKKQYHSVWSTAMPIYGRLWLQNIMSNSIVIIQTNRRCCSVL